MITNILLPQCSIATEPIQIAVLQLIPRPTKFRDKINLAVETPMKDSSLIGTCFKIVH